VATFSRRLKTLMTFSRSTYQWGKCSELWEEWEEEAAEVAEVRGVRGMLLTVLLNISVIQVLGGAVVDFLHESFQEVVFMSQIQRGCRL
jgi:hypothetical protein